MRFVTIDDEHGTTMPAALRDGGVVALRDLAPALPEGLASRVRAAKDVADIADIADVASIEGAIAELGLSPVAFDSLTMRAPVLEPGRVICVGLNYRSHAEEQGARIPPQPVLFAKWSESIADPGATVAPPYAEAQLDYECEVTVVIGRGGRDIPVEDALGHVFGVTAMNDLSERKAQLAERQWVRSKSFDGFAPLGPAVTTIDEFPDVGDIAVKTTLNGDVVQEGSTSDLIFDIPTLVSFASQGTTLRPGDVIATGTPSGVGFVKEPPVFLACGDVVTVEVERVGALTTTIGPVRGATA